MPGAYERGLRRPSPVTTGTRDAGPRLDFIRGLRFAFTSSICYFPLTFLTLCAIMKA